MIVEQQMQLNPFDANLYVFCNRSRDKLKILHWDKTGFMLWYKRLEQDKFKWPATESDSIIELNEQRFHWLLSGLPVIHPKPHQTLFYETWRQGVSHAMTASSN